jgi:hypothetical protein
MDKHQLELASSILGFLGGFVLSLDAIAAVNRAKSTKGKESISEAARKVQGEYQIDANDVPSSAYGLQLFLARRTATTARWGFVLMTLGFLLDIIAKFMPG